jgi:hypothetical protein
MRTLLRALLLVAGLALFVGLVANPVADLVARARLQRLDLKIVADTDQPAIAAEAYAARADVEKELKACGVQVVPVPASSRKEPELVLTVHGYFRCDGGGPAEGTLVENVELRLCGTPSGDAAAARGECADGWSRTTPLVSVPRGGPLPIRSQVLALVDEFIAEHHLPVRPAVPSNPRHIGWR